MTPAEHDALAQVVDALRDRLGRPTTHANNVRHVTRALRQLVADRRKRPAVLVALGLGSEGDE